VDAILLSASVVSLIAVGAALFGAGSSQGIAQVLQLRI